jgi:hypothetical protein
MAEGFVMPLSGEEIINDILVQVEKGLRSDCNLRSVDAYSGGYSGKIKAEIHLFAVDIAHVDMEITVSGQAKEGDIPVGQPVEVSTEIEIPRETNLDDVRERSGQGTPMSVSDEKTGQQEIKRRTYARPRTGGAAVEE